MHLVENNFFSQEISDVDWLKKATCCTFRFLSSSWCSTSIKKPTGNIYNHMSKAKSQQRNTVIDTGEKVEHTQNMTDRTQPSGR